MFHINIQYHEIIGPEYIPYTVVIMCINCDKSTGCLLDNQTIETFITIFVINMVLQHVGLSWIIQQNQKLNSGFQDYCSSWIISGQWYNTAICSQLNGLLYKDNVTTFICDKYNLMCSTEAHEREYKSVNDEASTGGVRLLP